ncbi:MAG: COX15/CtaA family protein [Rhodocyclaceae bacterium]|nr:COX15/CtaA family protein [Rhodocyclaceae bacterium]
MTDEAARLARLRRVGWALTCLCLAVVGLSAWLRFAGAGLGCADWPGCYAAFLGGAPHGVPAGVRIAHRLVATLALLLAVLAVWHSRRPAPLQPVAARAVVLLGLMLVLSVVGIWSADPRRVPVALANLLGGLVLVVLAHRVALAASPQGAAGIASPAPVPGRRPGLLGRTGLGLLAAAVLAGAFIGVRYAATACLSLTGCGGPDMVAALGVLADVDLLASPTVTPPGDAGGAALHLLHRLLGFAALLVLGTAAWRSWRPSRHPGALPLIALLAVETLLGLATVASGYSIWLAVAHNVGAALLLAAAAAWRASR